jgi:DNA excision repair protein ERCC-3
LTNIEKKADCNGCAKLLLWFHIGLALSLRISRRFGIPFIYGETKNRLDLIRESQVCVVSRVGEEGLSVAELERVIEFAGLYGSRMQESQRFGRLMHALKEEPEHIILFTEKEYEAYQKRLYAITERGFRIQYIR